MTALVEAYQQKDARAFETILQNNKASIMDDPFIRDYIEGMSLCLLASSKASTVWAPRAHEPAAHLDNAVHAQSE